MFPSFLGRAAVVAVAVLTPAIMAGAAQAAWSLGDTAAGPVVATVTAAPSGPAALYPGASVALSFTVTNPSDSPVTFTTVRFGEVTTDDEVACPASYVAVLAEGAVAIRVDGSRTSRVVSVPGAVTMHADAPDGCQGRVFSIETTLNGA